MKKIVIKVPVTSENSRKEALKKAVSVDGVSSVAMGGKDRDHVVVIGQGVDCINLTKILKRKMGSAEIVSVRELDGDYVFEEEEMNRPQWSEYTTRWYPSYHPPLQPVTYDGGYNPRPVYESNPDSCSIL